MTIDEMVAESIGVNPNGFHPSTNGNDTISIMKKYNIQIEPWPQIGQWRAMTDLCLGVSHFSDCYHEDLQMAVCMVVIDAAGIFDKPIKGDKT